MPIIARGGRGARATAPRSEPSPDPSPPRSRASCGLSCFLAGLLVGVACTLVAVSVILSTSPASPFTRGGAAAAETALPAPPRSSTTFRARGPSSGAGPPSRRWTPVGAPQSTEFWDLFWPATPPACQTQPIPRAAEQWATPLFIEDAVNVAAPHSLMSNTRLRVSLELALAVLALPADADIVETGVYKGGCTFLFLLALKTFDGCGRRVRVFDSWDGLPAPDADLDLGPAPFFEEIVEDFTRVGALRVGIGDFYKTLRGLDVLQSAADEQRLVATQGFYNETLRRGAQDIAAIGLLHLDGDYFWSTWDALDAFYDKIVPGGYVYVDDYHTFRGAAEAVDTFRWLRGIGEPLRYVREVKGLWQFSGASTWSEAVYWRKNEP